jgi:hypothetical protein
MPSSFPCPEGRLQAYPSHGWAYGSSPSDQSDPSPSVFFWSRSKQRTNCDFHFSKNHSNSSSPNASPDASTHVWACCSFRPNQADRQADDRPVKNSRKEFSL